MGGWLVWALAGLAWAGDPDHDGIKGSADKCPDRAEDKDGFQDDDGCPDPDNDSDGIDDADDKCPDKAEDKDGFQDEDGCPDPDNDADGVADDQDQCPIEAGDRPDGCPTVTLKLLSESGYYPAIGALLNDLLAAVGQEEKGCDTVTDQVRSWLGTNDVKKLKAEWDARLARAPAELDPNTALELLAKKGDVYRTLQPALTVYCKDHPAWVQLQGQVDGVFSALPPMPAPPPKKRH